jgi:hypothetical protein
MTDALAALRRIARSRPAPPVERCDLCATEVTADHAHLVDLETRRLMCACRPCYLLFTDDRAHLRYRAVPDRYRAFGSPLLDERGWDELQIPVGLAFLFRNSAQDRMVAFYPGPAGAVESEMDVPDRPAFAVLRPDIEALLVRRDAPAYLVPIDACYELVGRLRSVWTGFDGGPAARTAIEAFFADVRRRAS